MLKNKRLAPAPLPYTAKLGNSLAAGPMQSLVVYLYIMAVGFVAAGVLSSFTQLVSGEPLRFGIEPRSLVASLGGVLLRVLAGPAILMRNAWRGLRIQARAPIWFGLSILVAGVWSLFSGTLLLGLILSI
jgi:hypothetical protein